MRHACLVLALVVVGCSSSSTEANVPHDDGGTRDDTGAPDDGTCGDTTASAANCGACGHDCGGGACVASSCRSWVLATGGEGTSRLAVVGDDVYMQDGGTAPTLWKVSRHGGARTRVVYPTDVAYLEPALASDLIGDGDSLVLTYASTSLDFPALRITPSTGTFVARANHGYDYSATLVPGALFWLQGVIMRRIPIDTAAFATEPENAFAATDLQPFGGDGEALYVIDVPGKRVLRYGPDAVDATASHDVVGKTTGDGAWQSFRSGADAIYWTSFDLGTIYRMPKAGGDARAIATAPHVTALAAGARLYWSSGDDVHETTADGADVTFERATGVVGLLFDRGVLFIRTKDGRLVARVV